MVSGGFSLTKTKITDRKKTFAKNRFLKYCNRKSHQRVKDKNFAEIVLHFTLMVIFEVLNMVCGDFGLKTPRSTDHKETFTKNGFQNIATGSQIRAS